MGTPAAVTTIFPTSAYAVTASNTAAFPPSAIYVGSTGNVNVVTADGQTVLFTGAPSGSMLPVMCIQVLSTNTTASALVRTC